MKKAMTLVEVLVALTIFLLIFTLTLSIYASISIISKRQKQYTYFESICLDIDKYYDSYDKQWDIYYYNHNAEFGTVIYYSSSYQVSQNSDARYELEYKYDIDDHLVVSIKDIVNDNYVIKDLNYGVSKAR